MGAVRRRQRLLVAICLASAALLAGSVDAAAPGQGGASAGYTCDSDSRICKCTDFFDCKKMKAKVCADKTFDCAADGLSCSCTWKPPSKRPGSAYDLPIHPKPPTEEAR